MRSLLLTVLSLPALAQIVPARSFYDLPSANGHSAVMVDGRTGKLVHFREHLPATVLAAGVAGVALPVDHRSWDQVRELLALGTHAAAAAHVALVARRRIEGNP